MPDAAFSSDASVGLSRARTTCRPDACASFSAASFASAATSFWFAWLSASPMPLTSDSTWFSSCSSETMLYRTRYASTSRRLSATAASSFFDSSDASPSAVVEPPL